MGQYSDVQSAGLFGGVQAKFDTSGDPILNAMTDIAICAAERVTVLSNRNVNSYSADPDTIEPLTDQQIDTEDGPSTVVIPDPPALPDLPQTFASAVAYLDWLQTQAISSDVFPAYTDIIGTPPTAPTVDLNSISGMIPYSSIPTPSLTIPEWDESAAWSDAAEAAVASGSDLVAPFTYDEEDYVSPLIGTGGTNVLWDAVRNEIESGDYGINPATEELLFERMKDREARAFAGAMDGAMSAWSSGGFTAPTGAAAGAIARLQAESRDRIVSGNREIAIKRSELLLEAKRIAMTNGLQLDQNTMQFHNTRLDRILKSVIDGVTATIAVASHNLERGKIFLQKYVAFAQAFESRVRAGTAVADMYKAQIGAEESKSAFNKSLVDEFATKNKALIDGYAEEVKGFAAVVDGRVRYHGVLADFFKSKSAEIEYRARAMNGAYDLVEKSHATDVNFSVGVYEKQLVSAKLVLDKVMQTLSLKADQIKAQTQSLASIAQSAMNGMNVNLGLSVSGSASVSGSESLSESWDKTASDERRSRSWDETAGDMRRSHTESHSHDDTKEVSEGDVDITYHNLNA